MTSPRKAVRGNCEYCLNIENQRSDPKTKCENTLCFWYPVINGKKRFRIGMIREWCPKQCVGGDRKEYDSCTGVLLKGGTCPLHPFRDGRTHGKHTGNPNIHQFGSRTRFKKQIRTV